MFERPFALIRSVDDATRQWHRQLGTPHGPCNTHKKGILHGWAPFDCTWDKEPIAWLGFGRLLDACRFSNYCVYALEQPF